MLYLRERESVHRFNFNEETTMTSQQQIENEFDYRTMKERTRWLIVSLVVLAIVGAFCATRAYAQTANTATITFEPSTKYSDGTNYPAGSIVVYDLYQGLKGAAKVKVGTISSGGSVNTGLATGNEYCWDVVTVLKVNASAPVQLSEHSNEACKKFSGAPGVVTITVT